MRRASDLDHALREAGLVASVVVADKQPLPRPILALQEGPGMLAGAALGEVVDHGLHRLEDPWAVGPQICLVGLLLAWRQHRHWRLVGVQLAVGQDLLLQGIDRGCNRTPQVPTQSASVERDSAMPARAKMLSWRYSGKWSA